ncbi:MAG: imidazolonepropionase [Candidatus Bathyarchaeota archaeon]|nr:MAG: imidazolonepropionase [Candidatus Bathyarchaeota archaeon]
MTKAHVDLLITRANELITLRSDSHEPAKLDRMKDLGIIRDGAIAIAENRIVAAGPRNRIEHQFKPEMEVDASGKVVMPGFVDPHTHLVFAGSREKEFDRRLQGESYRDILAKGGGILDTVRWTRKASREQLVRQGKRTLDVMLKHGTTTVEAKTGYGLTTKDEVKCLEAAQELDKAHSVEVVSTFLGAHAVPPEHAHQPDNYVRLVAEVMIPEVADRGLAEFCDVFCEEGVFNVEQSRKILQAGRVHGLKPKIHADELTQQGGTELAAEINAVSAEHLLFASDNGLTAMAKKGVIAVLLPAAAFALMTGRYADARKAIQSKVPVALGTDFNPSCWAESMQMTIAIACREMRLTVGEAITAATINAAHAVDRAHEVGSLEPGKRANIIILDAPNYRFLGYRFGVNLVDKVIKDGKIVVDNRGV